MSAFCALDEKKKKTLSTNKIMLYGNINMNKNNHLK